MLALEKKVEEEVKKRKVTEYKLEQLIGITEDLVGFLQQEQKRRRPSPPSDVRVDDLVERFERIYGGVDLSNDD
jgi:hypothetical protein